jgi:hypothetical protein
MLKHRLYLKEVLYKPILSRKARFSIPKLNNTRGLGRGLRGPLSPKILFREPRPLGRLDLPGNGWPSSVSISRPLGAYVVRTWSGLDGSSHKDYVRRPRNSEGEHVGLSYPSRLFPPKSPHFYFSGCSGFHSKRPQTKILNARFLYNPYYHSQPENQRYDESEASYSRQIQIMATHTGMYY